MESVLGQRDRTIMFTSVILCHVIFWPNSAVANIEAACLQMSYFFSYRLGWSAELKCSTVVKDEGVSKLWGFFDPITGQNTGAVSQFSLLELTLLPAPHCGGSCFISFRQSHPGYLKLPSFPIWTVSWSKTGWKLLVWLSHSSSSRNGTCSCLHLVMTVIWISTADQNEESLQDLSDHSLGWAFRRLLISSMRNRIANVK